MAVNYGPNRYDVVGSFLRPAKLKQAREDFSAGAIDAAALKAVEDECITDLIAKEKKAGLRFITDGEFRRATWHLDFMWAFEGIGHSTTEDGLPFHDEAAKIDDTYLTGEDFARRRASLRRALPLRTVLRGREHHGEADDSRARAVHRAVHHAHEPQGDRRRIRKRRALRR